MMMRGVRGSCMPLQIVAALCLSTAVTASSSPVADASQRGDREEVRRLLQQGADVNAPQGDGMTALHWAAMTGDAALAQMLIYAGANVKATTRLGAYTPLHLAARAHHEVVVASLIAAKADVNVATAAGATPLMLAAAAGDPRVITTLIENGADINAADAPKALTPLMYAAAYGRTAAVGVLLSHGARPEMTSTVVDVSALTTPEEETAQRQRQQGRPVTGAAGAAAALPPARVPGVDRPLRYSELIGATGGFSALQFAAREGYVDTAKALLEGGASIDQANPADGTTPLVTAIVNGNFDLAMYLIELGADVNLAALNGVTPLYATINMQWHNKSPHPQPTAYRQQRTGYLLLMTALLEHGADPNARLRTKVWYSAFNSDFSGVDESGATAFWRAAYASDVAAMRLLLQYGADPHIPTIRPAGRPTAGDQARAFQDVSGLPPVPVGGPGVPPLLAAAGVGYGEGFAANSHRYAVTGFLPAIKFLVEEAGAEVNAIDHEGNTAIHMAASRGDTESILYLVSKGADVMRVNREGNTTADMANGPVQRTQPYPETLELLMKLGAINNHKCVTC
jgi:ankyrin repeat protein